MSQAVDILNTQEHCEVIRGKDLFYDYDKLFDKFYCKPTSGTIRTNHIFSFVKEQNQHLVRGISIFVRESDNFSEEHKQNISYTNQCFQYPQERDKEIDIENPILLDSTGLRYLKQVHLYTKWRCIVPYEYRDELCPKPRDEVISNVKQKRQSKKNSKKRTSQKFMKDINN